MCISVVIIITTMTSIITELGPKMEKSKVQLLNRLFDVSLRKLESSVGRKDFDGVIKKVFHLESKTTR